MIRSYILGAILTLVICSFCDKDFISIGRHSWRCQQKLRNHNHDELRTPQVNVVIENQSTVSNCSYVKCSCGKRCKGLRGLKTHQRSCRVIEGLQGDLFEQLDNDHNNDDLTNDDVTTELLTDIDVEMKPG